MTTKTKNLVYFEKWSAPVAETMLQGEAGITLRKLTYDSPEDDNWAVVERAHGIQLLPAFETRAPFLPGRALIERCPDLLALSVPGTGYDTVDVEACTEAGILLVNQAGANAVSVAQHVLGMMLVLSKQIVQGDRQMRRGPGDWGRWDFKGKELTGRTIGIIGLGNVGRQVAALTGGVFGMKVLAYDPYITDQDFKDRGAEAAGFDDIFRQSDFVSVNCPLTEETANMIGDAQYRMMKPTAYFITTARGGIQDEAALARVLSEDLIAGAGVDVFNPEPPPADHPLMAFDNVIISPHVAGITDDCLYNMAEYAAHQWLAIFKGERPPRLINPEAWPKYRDRFKAIIGHAAEE